MIPAITTAVEEYLRTSYPDGDREYVDGEILERNVGEIDHGALQLRIGAYLLQRFPRYFTGTEIRTQVSTTRFRIPDVLLIAGPRPSGTIVTSPPHIVIEILSPDDRAVYMQKKIDDYLAFGIPYVWVIDPQTREAWVHTAHGTQPVRDGILRAQSPDIEVPLAELFA